MSKKLRLTKIELETKGGKKVELSIDEARELHDQLHELFGEKYVPNQPIVIERDRYPYRYWWQSPVTCTPTWQGKVSPNNGGLDVQSSTNWINYCDSGLQISYTGKEVQHVQT